MKIVFDTNAWSDDISFDIKYFQCEFDDDMRPGDIVIGADRKTLEDIAEYCQIGWNIKEVDSLDHVPLAKDGKDFICSHLALYGRLMPFRIIKEDMHKVIYY